MVENADQYDPRAQAMEEVHFDWRCIVCCMVALSPFHLEQQCLPGTESVYFDLDNTPWLNVTIAIPLFICSVGSGNQFMLLDPDIFFAPFFVVGSFNFSCPLLFCIYSFSFPCHLKMVWKPWCPDTPKDKKKKPKPPSLGDRGGSTHANQKIGHFKAYVMRQCIEEINRVEAEAK